MVLVFLCVYTAVLLFAALRNILLHGLGSIFYSVLAAPAFPSALTARWLAPSGRISDGQLATCTVWGYVAYAVLLSLAMCLRRSRFVVLVWLVILLAVCANLVGCESVNERYVIWAP